MVHAKPMTSLLQLSFDLAGLDPAVAEAAAFACGASAVTFVDARDDPVFEPAPGEILLWGATRVQCLFPASDDVVALQCAVAVSLGVDVGAIEVRAVPERVWEREWLKHFHALRFGRRLWVCPHHERVDEPGAAAVMLDPGLAFGTGTHPSTGLCLEWLDAHLREPPAPAEHSKKAGAQGLDAHLQDPSAPAEHSKTARVIDYGCGSGILALAAVKLGAREAHCFDIDPQALIASADNAAANGIASRVHIHHSASTLPVGAEVLLANILAGPLCALAPRFASLVRPGGALVLAGLMSHEASEVTEAYAPCFHVVGFGERDGWVCLAGRRR
jgi:ribosomal protein L11 methyltransferase